MRPRTPRAGCASATLVAEDGEAVASQCLIEKGGNHSPVIERHARPIGIKDARDGCFQSVRPVVSYRQRFSEAFAFVVAGAQADRIHIAPVGFRLRMLERIAVALRCRTDEAPRAVPSRKLQHVPRPNRSGIQRLDGMLQIIDRARERREMKDAIHRTGQVQWFTNVVFDKAEIGVIEQMFDIFGVTGDEIVERDYRVSSFDQPIAKV